MWNKLAQDSSGAAALAYPKEQLGVFPAQTMVGNASPDESSARCVCVSLEEKTRLKEKEKEDVEKDHMRLEEDVYCNLASKLDE